MRRMMPSSPGAVESSILPSGAGTYADGGSDVDGVDVLQAPGRRRASCAWSGAVKARKISIARTKNGRMLKRLGPPAIIDHPGYRALAAANKHQDSDPGPGVPAFSAQARKST